MLLISDSNYILAPVSVSSICIDTSSELSCKFFSMCNMWLHLVSFAIPSYVVFYRWKLNSWFLLLFRFSHIKRDSQRTYESHVVALWKKPLQSIQPSFLSIITKFVFKINQLQTTFWLVGDVVNDWIQAHTI